MKIDAGWGCIWKPGRDHLGDRSRLLRKRQDRRCQHWEKLPKRALMKDAGHSDIEDMYGALTLDVGW